MWDKGDGIESIKLASFRIALSYATPFGADKFVKWIWCWWTNGEPGTMGLSPQCLGGRRFWVSSWDLETASVWMKFDTIEHMKMATKSRSLIGKLDWQDYLDWLLAQKQNYVEWMLLADRRGRDESQVLSKPGKEHGRKPLRLETDRKHLGVWHGRCEKSRHVYT